MYSPWLAYQRFYDPPGDRLLKLHLGGQETIDSRSTLDTVVVTTPLRSPRMAEFDARRKSPLGGGQFMTQEEIEKRRSVFATELVLSFKSIRERLSRGGGGQFRHFAVNRRGAGDVIGATKDCFMNVVVDGIPMPTPFNLDDLPSPKDLAGIEVYAGAATIPLQFKSWSRSCGVILVWTKDGS